MSAPPYRTALVTGASKGIGAAICRRLALEGLEVLALARSGEALQALAAQNPRIVAVVADVTRLETLARAIEGREIDVLVNNAGGVASVRALQEQSSQETAETIALNLTAPLQLIQLLLPGMIARGRGHIFNLTSTAAHHVFTGTTAYGAAKAALSQAGKILRYDLAGTNVRLTEIIPGRVETDFYLEAFSGDRARLTERMYTAQRALRPEDIAAALVAAMTMPQHVDLAQIEITPTDQATGGYVYGTVDRAG